MTFQLDSMIAGGTVPPAPLLRSGERLLFGLVLGVFAISIALTIGLGRKVDWTGFAPGIFAALALVATALYARQKKNAHRLALCGIGIGIFMGFTAFASIAIFALFPLPNPLIDPLLMRMDAGLGYDWAGFVEGLARYPLPASWLRHLYQSSLFQIAGLVVLLGVMGREATLQRLLLVGILAMIAAISLWWIWPSVGPAAFAMPDADSVKAAGLAVTPAYGEHLLDLVTRGPQVIAPAIIDGVVAFPSYHMIMALMVAYYGWSTPARWPLALASLFMVPATLAHGGHHLVDLLGGAVVFILCAALARRMIAETPHPGVALTR